MQTTFAETWSGRMMMLIPSRALRCRAIWGGLAAGLWVAWVASSVAFAAAEGAGTLDTPPGLGFVYGRGQTTDGGETRRFGITLRRLQDNDRAGSLALVGEEFRQGIGFSLREAAFDPSSVTLTYRSLFLELKRYFPLGGRFLYYWGVRGGYGRLSGAVRDGSGEPLEEFQADAAAPLILLALPLMLEHPGFLLLGLVDGGSAGVVLDIVPERLWLDLQVGSVLLPRRQDAYLATGGVPATFQTLQLVAVF